MFAPNSAVIVREHSAVIVREPEDEPPRILILGGNNYAWAYLTSPWEVYPGGSIGNVDGYGERFS
jgi:hypothetical protein